MTDEAECCQSHCGIPAVWVVLNNRTIGIEREAVEAIYGRSSFCDSRIAESGESWSSGNVKLAESIGIAGERVSRSDELGPALRNAIEKDEPSVLDVQVNPTEEGYRLTILPIPMRWEQGPVIQSMG